MSGLTSQRVPLDLRQQALSFLLTGQAEIHRSTERIKVFQNWIDTQTLGSWMYWVRRQNTPCAAAMIVETPGRCGLLFHSALNDRCRQDALALAASAATADALAGLAYIQILVDPSCCDQQELLEGCGYRLLAELAYMQMDIGGVVCKVCDELKWKNFCQFDQQLLESVISATYEDSLDCPALTPLRRMGEVVAAHQATGVYRPDRWWICWKDGKPAGCVLVNDCLSENRSEIVYLGVTKPFRRMGVGKALLEQGVFYAKSEQKSVLTLAVDDSNHHAKKLYDNFGFRLTHRRLAYAALGKRI